MWPLPLHRPGGGKDSPVAHEAPNGLLPRRVFLDERSHPGVYIGPQGTAGVVQGNAEMRVPQEKLVFGFVPRFTTQLRVQRIELFVLKHPANPRCRP